MGSRSFVDFRLQNYAFPVEKPFYKPIKSQNILRKNADYAQKSHFFNRFHKIAHEGITIGQSA